MPESRCCPCFPCRPSSCAGLGGCSSSQGPTFAPWSVWKKLVLGLIGQELGLSALVLRGVPGKGWWRRHLAVKRGLGQRMAPSCLGYLSLPCHQQQSNSGPPLAWTVPSVKLAADPPRTEDLKYWMDAGSRPYCIWDVCSLSLGSGCSSLGRMMQSVVKKGQTMGFRLRAMQGHTGV